jgi:hypothetical protein
MIFILKVLSGEMYRAHSTGLETSRRCFRKNRPSPSRARTLRLKGVISYSNEAVNEQMRSKAHSALTAPLVLHHTRIYECAMKQKSFSLDGINIFSMVFYHSSLGAMNAARLCKLRKGVKKNASIFSNFNGEKWTKCAVNISAAF